MTYKLDILTEVMFALTRAGVLGSRPALPEVADIDWDRLMDLSMEHGLLAWVWEGIALLPPQQQPGRQQRINWGLSVQNLTRQGEQQAAALARLVACCDDNHMRMLLLKGFSLARLYPNPSARPSSDIDIYLFEDYKKGNRVLFGNSGHFGGKHYVATFDGVAVENHLWMIDTGSFLQRKVEKYLRQAAEAGMRTEAGYYVFRPEDQLLYVLMHALAHLNNNGDDPLKVRSIVDLGYLLHTLTDVAVAERFQRLIQRFRLQKALSLFVDLSEQVLQVDLSRYKPAGSPQNADVERALRLILEEDYRRPEFLHLPIYKRIGDRWRYYREVRWRFRYLPGKGLDRLRALAFTIVYQLGKVLLRIPHDVSYHEGLGIRRRKQE